MGFSQHRLPERYARAAMWWVGRQAWGLVPALVREDSPMGPGKKRDRTRPPQEQGGGARATVPTDGPTGMPSWGRSLGGLARGMHT